MNKHLDFLHRCVTMTLLTFAGCCNAACPSRDSACVRSLPDSHELKPCPFAWTATLLSSSSSTRSAKEHIRNSVDNNEGRSVLF